MNDSKITKFENPIRLAELNPRAALIKAGFNENMVLCDIGAGTGIFSFPAAQISKNNIYALDISDNMIELLKSRKAERKVQNLEIRKVNSVELPIDSSTCDMAIMVTVLHEIEDKQSMLNEVKRILKPKGRLLIIEFHKRSTPMGPPVDHRISEDTTEKVCNDDGLNTIAKFSLGENFYGMVFES